jgi:hypothetical protein
MRCFQRRCNNAPQFVGVLQRDLGVVLVCEDCASTVARWRGAELHRLADVLADSSRLGPNGEAKLTAALRIRERRG